MYLLPELNLKLRPMILDMKPGTRVTSHQFTMGDWEPDETAEVDYRTAYLWIVPAKVEGAWTLREQGRKCTVHRQPQPEVSENHGRRRRFGEQPLVGATCAAKRFALRLTTTKASRAR